MDSPMTDTVSVGREVIHTVGGPTTFGATCWNVDGLSTQWRHSHDAAAAGAAATGAALFVALELWPWQVANMKRSLSRASRSTWVVYTWRAPDMVAFVCPLRLVSTNCTLHLREPSEFRGPTHAMRRPIVIEARHQSQITTFIFSHFAALGCCHRLRRHQRQCLVDFVRSHNPHTIIIGDLNLVDAAEISEFRQDLQHMTNMEVGALDRANEIGRLPRPLSLISCFVCLRPPGHSVLIGARGRGSTAAHRPAIYVGLTMAAYPMLPFIAPS